jgi:hypothetical protein
MVKSFIGGYFMGNNTSEIIDSYIENGYQSRYFSILNNIVIEQIKKEKKEKYELLKNVNVDTLISFISFAKVEEFDLSAFEKTLILFDNIKSIFILNSKESFEIAKNIISKLKNKYLVKLITVNIEDYDKLYVELLELIESNSINRKNIIIDTTQGTRMVGAVFYKFSIEQGIKVVSWQGEQRNNSKGRSIRIPGSDKFHFIKEPELKNYKLYNSINSLIKNYKFLEASLLYEQINNRELSFSLKKLSGIINHSSLYSYKNFITTIKKIIDELYNYPYKDLKNIMPKYIWFFNQFLKKDINTNIDEYFEQLDKMNWNELNYYHLHTNNFINKNWFSENIKKYLYILIYIDFIKHYYHKELAIELFETCIEFIPLTQKHFTGLELYNMSIEDITFEIEDLGLLQNEFEVEVWTVISKLLKQNILYNLCDDFTKKLDFNITLKDGILYIPHKQIQIDFAKELSKMKKANAKEVIAIYKLCESPKYILENNKLIKELFESSEEITIDYGNNVMTRIKKLIKQLNKIANPFLNIENLFLLENNSKIDNIPLFKRKKLSINYDLFRK